MYCNDRVFLILICYFNFNEDFLEYLKFIFHIVHSYHLQKGQEIQQYHIKSIKWLPIDILKISEEDLKFMISSLILGNRLNMTTIFQVYHLRFLRFLK